jgi:hypothetical protein
MFDESGQTAGTGTAPAAHAGRSPDGFDAISEDAVILNAAGAEMRRLWAEGVPGSATIAAMRDTGRRLAGNSVLELDLVVTLVGRTPYTTTVRLPIGGTELGPYGAGARYNVKVDPQDRDRLTFSA